MVGAMSRALETAAAIVAASDARFRASDAWTIYGDINAQNQRRTPLEWAAVRLIEAHASACAHRQGIRAEIRAARRGPYHGSPEHPSVAARRIRAAGGLAYYRNRHRNYLAVQALFERALAAEAPRQSLAA